MSARSRAGISQPPLLKNTSFFRCACCVVEPKAATGEDEFMGAVHEHVLHLEHRHK
jgi:hypothetical protein